MMQLRRFYLRMSLFDQAYEKKMAGEDKMKKMDEIDSHRVAVSKFVQKVCQFQQETLCECGNEL